MFPVTAGQFDLVYNSLSFTLASMMASTIFFWLRLGSVNEKYKSAMTITGLVTFIAAYHYFRIFNSWTEAYEFGPANNGEVGDPTITGKPFNDAYRYMDWLLTVPLLLIEIVFCCNLSDEAMAKKAWTLGIASGLMIAFGYPGELIIEGDLSVRFVFWTLGMIPFLYVVYTLLVGLTDAIKSVANCWCMTFAENSRPEKASDIMRPAPEIMPPVFATPKTMLSLSLRPRFLNLFPTSASGGNREGDEGQEQRRREREAEEGHLGERGVAARGGAEQRADDEAERLEGVGEGEERRDVGLAERVGDRREQRLHHRDDAAEARALEREAGHQQRERHRPRQRVRDAAEPDERQARRRQREPDPHPAPRRQPPASVERADDGRRDAVHRGHRRAPHDARVRALPLRGSSVPPPRQPALPDQPSASIGPAECAFALCLGVKA